MTSQTHFISCHVEFSYDSLTDHGHSDAESDEPQSFERKRFKFPKKPDSLLPENDPGMYISERTEGKIICGHSILIDVYC